MRRGGPQSRPASRGVMRPCQRLVKKPSTEEADRRQLGREDMCEESLARAAGDLQIECSLSTNRVGKACFGPTEDRARVRIDKRHDAADGSKEANGHRPIVRCVDTERPRAYSLRETTGDCDGWKWALRPRPLRITQ